MEFEGPRATIADSNVHARWGFAYVIWRNAINGDLPFGTVFSVEGDRNILRDNTLAISSGGLVFDVSGTANTLDGNIVARVENGAFGGGMRFTADGNFYASRRCRRSARRARVLGRTRRPTRL